jgi:hypothetical protein
MYENAHYKGSSTTEGNVEAYFRTFEQLIALNDRAHDFDTTTENSHDNPCPFNDGQETTVKITHPMQQITQLEDGFITFEIQATFQIDGLVLIPAKPVPEDEEDDAILEDGSALYPPNWGAASTETEIPQLFVGFKNSAEILDQLQVICRGRSVGIQDNECLREGFAYNTIRSVETKKKRYDHSLWEHVDERRSGVCGTYIPITKFVKGNADATVLSIQPVTVTFEVNLPITDILCMQAFTLYPNFCLGDLELKFYVKRSGLVWAQVSPLKMWQQCVAGLGQWTYDPVRLGQITSMDGNIKHGFTQIANPATITTGFWYGGKTPMVTSTGPCTLTCTNFIVTRCKSTILAFNVRETARLGIQNFFSKSQYLPSQELVYYAFPHPATANGFQSSINVPLHNCNCISFMFPRDPKDRTVFENINYQNVQCTIANNNYPSDPFTTTGARFLQYQLIASDLDGPIEPSKEYIDSIAGAKVHASFTTRAKLFDESSFMLNIQLERSGAGYCFDGIDTNGQNISIQLKGNPITSGITDTYYCAEGTGDDPEKYKHPPPPEAWICQETFWEMNTQIGIRYMSTGLPPNSQAQF